MEKLNQIEHIAKVNASEWRSITAVDTQAILAIAEAFRVLEQERDDLQIALRETTKCGLDHMYRAEAAEAKLKELEKQEVVVEVSVDGRAADDYTFTISKTLPDGVHELFIRPAPAVSLAELVPEGWKLVPVEPTEEMNKAGWAAMNEHDAINPTYRAMLEAAPEQK